MVILTTRGVLPVSLQILFVKCDALYKSLFPPFEVTLDFLRIDIVQLGNILTTNSRCTIPRASFVLTVVKKFVLVLIWLFKVMLKFKRIVLWPYVPKKIKGNRSVRFRVKIKAPLEMTHNILKNTLLIVTNCFVSTELQTLKLIFRQNPKKLESYILVQIVMSVLT